MTSGISFGSILLAAALVSVPAGAAVPVYGYRVVHAYPHDPSAFTEGLFYREGVLYESTGPTHGETGAAGSSIRRVRLETGEVLQRREIGPDYFGEGVVAAKGRLIELTWRSHVGFIYDLRTFRPEGRFSYSGEGWGLTTDGARIVMSDGTPFLRWLDPTSLKEIGRVEVTDEGRPVDNLNELEWVRGEIYANVWQTDRIARIDPKTGHVVGWIDLTGLLSPLARRFAEPDVLNGIAYDARHDRLFVTGKQWPLLFEIELVPKPSGTP